jgi:AcrR family transcriptional regulator
MPSSYAALEKGYGQRALLFEALLQLVLEHGPRGFGIQELTTRAEVSQSTFFRLAKSLDKLLQEFWPWCWDQLNSYLAEQVFANPERADALTALLRETDYIWDLHGDDRMEGIAFICFLYYRRANEFGNGEVSTQQRLFENRIGKLCSAVVDESTSEASPEVLQIMVMNWCATVLMSWQYFPQASSEFTVHHARLGLRRLVDDILTGDDAFFGTEVA